MPLVAASLLLFLVGISFVKHLTDEQKNESILQEAESVQSHLQSALDTKAEVMVASLHFIAQDKQLIAALRAGDRPRLLALAMPIYKHLHQAHNVTHFYFHDAHRVNLLRVHKPEKYGDTINRFTALGAEKTSALFSGIELGPLGTFTLRSVLPIRDAGQLLGYIELGQEIDALLEDVHRMCHVELFMLVGKQYLVQSDWEAGMRMLDRPYDWNSLSAAVLVSQTLRDAPIRLLNQITSDRTATGIRIRGDIDLQGDHYWAAIIPIQDAGRRPVTTLILLRDMTRSIAHARADMLWFTGIFIVVGLTILTFFYFILGQTEQALASARQRLIAEGKAREAMQSRFIQELQDEHRKLQESQERFEKITTSAQDAIICMDNDGNISFWNRAAETTFGYTQAEVLGRNLHELIVPERFRAAHYKAFPAFQETGQGAALGKTLELAAIRKGGMEFPIELSLSGTQIAGKWNGIGLLRDITERKKAQQEIEQALNVQRVLDTILNISLPPLTLQAVLLKSLDAVLAIPTFALLNKGAIFVAVEGEDTLRMEAQRNLPNALLHACAMLPFGHCLCGKAAASREIVFFNHLNDQHVITYDGIQPHGHYCVPILSEGRTLGVLNAYVAAGHISDDAERRFLRPVADTLAIVIERKRDEERLRQMAHYDKLTGLPNRVLFYDRIERALAQARRHHEDFAVLFLDLDHFKAINDTLGHDMGDTLLKEAARRLLTCVRELDTVARMGGDEFTVIVTDMKTQEGAACVAKNILKALLEPFELNGTPHTIGCSIGIALFPVHGHDRETLLKHADVAMYQAKQQRNTFCFFTDDQGI